MALDTIHFSLNHRVMLGKMKLRAGFLMALKARLRVFPWINNELFLAAATCHGDVLAPGAVTRFAAGSAWHFGIFHAQPRMRTGRKNTGDAGMAIQTRLIADVSGALDLKRHDDRTVGRTGIEQQKQRAGAHHCGGQIRQALQLEIAHESTVLRNDILFEMPKPPVCSRKNSFGQHFFKFFWNKFSNSTLLTGK
jgi:hypothetical protein